MSENQASFWGQFSPLNAGYVQDLYERYRANPAEVDPATRTLFETWGEPPAEVAPSPTPAPSPGSPTAAAPTPLTAAPLAPDVNCQHIAGAVQLATAIRSHGHRAALLDPLGSPPPGDASLLPETYGLTESDLASLPPTIIDGPVAARAQNALDAIRSLRRIYEGPAGYEFEHVSNAEERNWLRTAVESGRFAPPLDPINELSLLERLTAVGALEAFLDKAFPNQTRFSLEGLDIMVPVLDEIIGAAAEAGTRWVLLGMAHRGRLNVLAHVLGKSYEQIIAEFMGHFRRSHVSASDASDYGWTGDVKYHMGARKAFRGGKQVEMLVSLAPNPSHLEWVNPVVEGMTRACYERRDAPGPARQDELSSLALLIHGDAAFPGQGIVSETLNLSRLPGFRTGGTIHVIANNQLGFTTNPSSGRSTLYASDLAKGFEIPVIHVNANMPEACIAAARLSHAYRERFRKDVLIDLIGFRRHGHNEGDEPAFTQPKLYEVVARTPSARERWAEELVRRGLTTAAEAQATYDGAMEKLYAIRRGIQEAPKAEEPASSSSSGLEAGGASGGLGHAGAAARIQTAVPFETLSSYNQSLYTLPSSFHLHPKLDRSFARRLEVFGEPPEKAQIEWAHAEALAFASILADGNPIRLTGQDVERGTFSQRHAVLHDHQTGEQYIPLHVLPAASASFEVWNGPLSEQATLSFEFGYTLQAPATLVLWEAQYGDFINVAQAVIDQFILSARSKWEQTSGLVMLLPHGYEGQGPEHSSARLERFLQQAAEDNMRIANCTTSAQYFHILRRQAQLLSIDPRPLVLLTPKSLLRNPLAASPLRELAESRFRPLLPDPAPKNPKRVLRLVLCSGKVYYDLLQYELMASRSSGSNGATSRVAVARVEELYPFPADDIAAMLKEYENLEEVVWVQEEPRNMGAWTYVAPRLRDILGGKLPLQYIGRTRRASPAEGSHGWHLREQGRLVSAAWRVGSAALEESPRREVEHAS